jgi:uncharacterized membrane protein YeaQ/YmgE (transglycosylase-associated protein family)
MANSAEARCRQNRRARMSAVPCWGGTGVMMLETNSIIVILLIGLIAGWLAGKIMGGGFGLIGDIIIGVIGAFIGTWLWGVLHLPMIANFWISAIVISTVGACILLFIIRLLKR